MDGVVFLHSNYWNTLLVCILYSGNKAGMVQVPYTLILMLTLQQVPIDYHVHDV